MSKIAVQISPEAKAAYFSDYLHVARSEARQVLGDIEIEYTRKGALEFFILEDERLRLERILRLSFVQGVYAVEGDLLRPVDLAADFRLHEDFVFGSKYKGKTNERLTQMLINIGLSAIAKETAEGVRLLDPMCGRATTLLWAMRYGMTARGIEHDAKALADIQRNLKKWSKLHRQKHKMYEGFIGETRKKSIGKFIDFTAEESSMRMVVGNACDADQLFKKEKFDLVVSDLPYGVQHFTAEGARNPLNLIAQCVGPWRRCLKLDGAIVLAYNRNIPKREALTKVFEQEGVMALPFSAEHRMSESIVRDVIVLKP